MVGGLMFLVDTNVWLEVLLEQERAAEAREFIEKTDSKSLAITDFSLYSIGIILTRLNKDTAFEDFLSDTIEDSSVTRIRLEVRDLKQIPDYRKRFQLDFDDAYQSVAALKHGCTLVSFDSDFDRTPTGRETPSQVISR